MKHLLSTWGRTKLEKLAMDTRTFFHGSPEDLETLELRVPPNHTAKGVPGDAAVYAAESPIAAALYALARNSSKGSWGVSKDNRLIMKSTKELNPFGYVYELESSDYTSPPEDNLALGFAVKDPKIKSKKRVSAAELQEFIDRVETTEELLQQMGLSKTSSDISVLTAVPKQNLDLILRKGLYSQKAMLNDPEVLAAFIAQRNADKGWGNEDQYDEKRFREQYAERLKRMEGDDASISGPSVFFTEPDPDKVSDPRHFINKFDTQNIRINLAKLLQDIPDTRIQGAELIPFPENAQSMSDDEWAEIAKQRKRDLTAEEVEKYIATDPKELWKHYGEEHLGRYYAANVPHAFIRTPSGVIPPEYLEPVVKTSSARGQLEHFLYKRASLEDTFTPDFTPDDLKALGVYDQVYGDAPREASMKEWPAHWINEQDPLGWLQWYERYSGGRRTEDDARQIKRWNSFKARHLAQYLKNPTPRRAAALRNWGIDVEKHK